MPPGPSLEATGSVIQYNSVESASPTLVIGRGAGEPEDGPERKTHLAACQQKRVLPNNAQEHAAAASSPPPRDAVMRHSPSCQALSTPNTALTSKGARTALF